MHTVYKKKLSENNYSEKELCWWNNSIHNDLRESIENQFTFNREMVLTFVNPTLDPPPKLVTVSVSVSFVFKHFARRLFEVPGNEALSTEALTDRSHLHLAAIIAMDRGDNWEITPSGWDIALIDRGTPAYFTNHWYLTSKEIICFTTKIIRRMVTIFLIFEFDSHISLCDILLRLQIKYDASTIQTL